ncbi:hypothetical protein [Microbacterium album]|nr:hypothetical protein [Microbacterium album]
MSTRSARSRPLAALAVLLGAGALLLGGPVAAHAEERDVLVVVPAPTPSPTPSQPAPPPAPPAPPAQTPGGGSGDAPGDTPPGDAPAGPGAPAPAPRPAGATNTPADPGPDAPAECTPTEPPLPAAPATSGEEATLQDGVYLPGERATATAEGFEPGEQVQVVLFSDPQLVGTFSADDEGTVRAQFPVPDDTRAGTHTLQFTGWCDRIAQASMLVGAPDSAGEDDAFGVPTWAWWAGGILLTGVVLYGAYSAITAMRAVTPEATA